VPLPVLLLAVSGWVAAELDRPMPAALPVVSFMEPEAMAALRRQAEGIHLDVDLARPGLLAMFEPASDTIYLPRWWTGGSAAEVSILVHELVHWFQALAGDRHACPAARERLAFEVQERWLQAHGTSLETAFGIDGLFLLVATNCMF
jgi:hypothetical protein